MKTYNLKLTDEQVYALGWALRLSLEGIRKSLKKCKDIKTKDVLCKLSTDMTCVKGKLTKLNEED